MNLSQSISLFAAKSAPTICTDLDDTLLEYDGYKKGKFGERDEDAVAVLKDQKKKGCRIIVHTARKKDEWPALAKHLKSLGVPFDGITNVKPPECKAFLDDRAVEWPVKPEKAIRRIERLVSQSAGTQSIEPAAGEDESIKSYLRKKMDKLDKKRRAVTPYPEDKSGVQAGGLGSGCRGPNCGRKHGPGTIKDIAESVPRMYRKVLKKIRKAVKNKNWKKAKSYMYKLMKMGDRERFERGEEIAHSFPKRLSYKIIMAAVKEVGHWSPAPEDVSALNKKGYKSGMRKKRVVQLHTTPGAVPVQDITGRRMPDSRILRRRLRGYGTSESVRKGWENRRRKSAVGKPRTGSLFQDWKYDLPDEYKGGRKEYFQKLSKSK